MISYLTTLPFSSIRRRAVFLTNEEKANVNGIPPASARRIATCLLLVEFSTIVVGSVAWASGMAIVRGSTAFGASPPPALLCFLLHDRLLYGHLLTTGKVLVS